MENFEDIDGKPPDTGLPELTGYDDFSTMEVSGLPAGEKKQSGVLEETSAIKEEFHQPPPHEFGDTNTDVDILACDEGDSQPQSSGPPSQDLRPAPGEEKIEDMSDGPEAEMSVSDSEENEKEPLSYELQQGFRILREIMSDGNKSLNWPFMEPVDSEGMGLQDYASRIKEPMWLKKIQMKFDDRYYNNITDFARDFRLMLENCYRYNGPDHYISKRGQKLETVFEQKLSLLSRDLRAKTSRAATSGKPIEDKMITGTRRRKVLSPQDSSDLLNQLRLEEKEREREQRRQQVEERRQQQLAFTQDLMDWDDKLLGPGGRERLEAMWELPQIGHFLFLCADVMNLGEVMQWELERSFWMPRQSTTLHLIMTSLLSTPYQRTRLDTKPPMPYNVWEEKLRTRVRNWYKVFNEQNRDTKKTHLKLGLDERFFKILGVTNPLEKRPFHELTYYQRVWVAKGLCDWCLETQESVREAFERLPVDETREYSLGVDAEGNRYIHFPQFCGQDLRVYRVAPIEMPKTGRPRVPKEKVTSPPKKKKKRSTARKASPTPRRGQSSRLRQNPKQVKKSPSLSENGENSASDSGISESEESISRKSPRSKQSRRTRTPSPSPSSTPLKQPPKTGRSSRNSAAARDWMPRGSTSIGSVNSPRGTRSRRLTCAPESVPSGSSTPTTNATPSGSRSSTPVTKDRSSRSSTPSLETSSLSSSPRKWPSGRRKEQRKGGRKAQKADSDVSEDEMETDDRDLEDGEHCNNDASQSVVKKEVEDSVSIPDQGSVSVTSNPDSVIRSTPSSPSLSSTSKSEIIGIDPAPSGAALLNGIPGDEGDYKTPFSSYKTGVSDDASTVLDPSDKDSKSDCDTETKPALVKGQQMLPNVVALTADIIPKSEMDDSNMCENSETLTFAQGRGSQNSDNDCKNTLAVDSFSLPLKMEVDVSGQQSIGDEGITIKIEPREESMTSDNSEPTKLEQSGNVMYETLVKQEPGENLVGDLESNNEKSVATSHTDTADQTTVKREDSKEPPILFSVAGAQTPSDGLVDGLSSVKEENGEDVKVKTETFDMNCPGEEVLSLADNSKQLVKEEIACETGESENIGEETKEVKQEPEEVAPEIEHPTIGPFKLVADTVEKLRQLSLQFAEPEPIIEIKGKKEKILRPPPRKKCVSELYERMCYLLSELEPWESKLVAANKKARIKIRKEFESYVEETEPKKEEVEDVWESEEEQTEEEEEEESEEESDETKEETEIKQEEVEEEPETQPVPVAATKSKATRKSSSPAPVVSETQGMIASATPSDNPEKSMFGRVRKRKVIPNSYDEPPPVVKKKKGKDNENSQATTPNILQSSRNKNPGAQSSMNHLQTVLSKAKPITAPSSLPAGMQLLNINGQTVLLNTNTNPPVILQTSAPLSLNNLNLLAQLSAKAAAGNSLRTKVTVSNSQPSTNSPPSPTPKVTASMSATKTPSTNQVPQQVIRTLLAANNAPQHPKATPTALQKPVKAPKPLQLPVQKQSLTRAPISPNSTAATGFGEVNGAPSVSSEEDVKPPLSPQSSDGNVQLDPSRRMERVQYYNMERLQYYKFNDVNQMKATIKQQLAKPIRLKSPVTSPTQLTNTALGNLIQAGLLPQTSQPEVKPQLPIASPASPPQSQSLPISHSDTSPIMTAAIVVTAAAETPTTAVVSSSEYPSQSQHLQNLISPIKEELDKSIAAPGTLTISTLPTTSPPTVVATRPHVLNLSPSSNTALSPTNIVSPTSGSLPTSPTPMSSKAQAQALPPEVRDALKLSEFHLGKLMSTSPGLVRALSSLGGTGHGTRPKYANNVTVKSLLESRALRQKAQQGSDSESVKEPLSCVRVISPLKNTPVATTTKVNIPMQAAEPLSYVRVISPLKKQGTPASKATAPLQVQAVAATAPVSQPLKSPVPQTQPPLVKPKVQIQPGVNALPSHSAKGTGATPIEARAARIPLQLQAIRTSQGTILRMPSGQQITLRTATQRLPAPARPPASNNSQLALQMASPAPPLSSSTSIAIPGPPAAPLFHGSSISPVSSQENAIDKAVKLVVTSVHTSLPTAQMNISTPLSLTGQQQPLRQVTSTVSTMSAPIPAFKLITEESPVSKSSTGQVGNASTRISAVQPAQVVSSALPTSASVLQNVSGTGQKNVILRVLPQQLSNAQTGSVSVVLPQQVLQQTIKSDGNAAAKMVLQSATGDVQLVQAHQAKQTNPARVLHSPTRFASTSPRKGTLPTSVLRSVKTVYPASMDKILQSAHTVNSLPSENTIVQLNPQQALTSHSIATVGNVASGVGKQIKHQQGHTDSPLTSPVKQTQAQPSIRIVSPQQLTLSSAGLVPVQMPVSAGQLVSTLSSNPTSVKRVLPQSLTPNVNICSNPLVSQTVESLQGERVNVQAKNSLDLLAAASMLHEAKVPLDKPQILTDNNTSTVPVSQITLASVNHQTSNPTPLILSPTKVNVTSGGQIVSGLVTQQTSEADSKAAAVPLKDVHQQQARVLQQQLALQQQLLQEQQKQQRILQQIAIQQQQQKVVTQIPQTIPQPVSSPLLSPPQLASRVLVTTTAKTASTLTSTSPVSSSVAVVSANSGVSTGSVQMAGIMASAGGRMVQLRFAVPQGMTVQQLLQTPQFQQQLVALKVSAIHGITTSTVAVTTTPTPSTTTQAGTAILKSTPSTAVKPSVSVSSQSPVTQVALTSSNKIAPSANTSKMQIITSLATTSNTAATITAASAGKGTPISSGQHKEKVTLFLNVNGQLVQTQGLPLNARVAAQGSPANSSKVATALPQAGTTKVVNLASLSNLTGVRPVVQTSQPRSQPTLLASLQQQPRIITSPAKVQVPQHGVVSSATSQGLVLAPQQQVVLTRPAGRNVVRIQSPVSVNSQRLQINVPAASLVSLTPSSNIATQVAPTVVSPPGSVPMSVYGLPNGK